MVISFKINISEEAIKEKKNQARHFKLRSFHHFFKLVQFERETSMPWVVGNYGSQMAFSI